MKAIQLSGFESKFDRDADPWRTFTDRDEARKRRAILHGLGPGPVGRVIELAAGNGSNSVALAPIALRLDATEGTDSGTELVKHATRDFPHVHVSKLILPGRFPLTRYDAAIVAEVLYYLSPDDMAQVARDLAAAVRIGGRLVLAHHRVDYPDFAQHAQNIHKRFLAATRVRWRPLATDIRTGRWRVAAFIRSEPAQRRGWSPTALA